VVAVLAAGLDVSWLNELALTEPLQDGAVLSLVDRAGTVVARYPEDPSAVGQPLPESAIVERMGQVSETTIEQDGADGVKRIYAFTPVRGRVESGLRLVVGIPVVAAYAEVSREQTRQLWALGIGSVLTLLLAWWSIERLVLQRVASLLEATRRLAAGDPAARSNLSYGQGELGDLAKAFDEMANALELRQQERDRAEEALRESEARFRVFMDHSPAMTFVKDEAGRFVYANSAFERYFELTRDQWFGRTDADLWAGDVARRFRRDDLRVLETGEPLRVVEVVPHPSGRDGRWLTVKFRVADRVGQALVAGMSLDLTEGHDVRQELGRVERRYSELFEQASDGVMLLSVEGEIQSANEAACAMTGRARDALRGQRLEALFVGTTSSVWPRAAEDRSGSTRFEQWIGRPDGGQVLAEITATASDAGGLLVFLRDVTAAHAAEKALRESEERYRRLYQYLPLPYQSMTEDATIVQVNDAWASLTGASVEAAIDSRFEQWLPPASVGRFRAGFAKVLETGMLRGLEVTVVRPNRAAAVVSLDGRLGSDAHGRRLVHFVMRDVTAAREAERRLRVSEERSRTLFDESPVALWEQDCSGIKRHIERLHLLGVTDLEAHFAAHPDELADCVGAISIVDVNKATLGLFGAEHRSQVLGGAQLLRGLEGQALFAQAILALARGEQTWQHEGPSATLHGEIIHLALRWVVVPGSEATWSRVLVSALDVTDRLRARAELSDWERRFDVAFRSNPALMGISTLGEGRYLEVNDAFLTTLGYRREEVIGRTSAELGLWADPGERSRALERLHLTGGLSNVEMRFRTRSGRLVTCLCSAVPIVTREEPCLLVQAVDVTEHRRALEADHESQRMLRTLLSNLPGMVYRCCTDPEWTMLFVSDGCRELTGYDAADLLGNRRVSYASLIVEEDREAVVQAVREGIDERRPFRVIYRVRCADGTVKWVWEQGQVAQSLDDRAVTLEGFIADITAQKRAEEELARSAEQLRQAQKMEAVGRLAGGIAHDFNNLLTAILGYAEMVLHHVEPDSETGSRVEEIRKAGERAARLTRQLLAFSRKQVLSLEVFSLDSVLDEMTPMLDRLIGEHIDLRISSGGSGHIKADRTQVEQVILNLAVNARDAMPGGGAMTIEARSAVVEEVREGMPAGLSPGRYARLVISDTGTGMDAQTLGHLFEPFFTTKGPGRGTGLGLSTVYGIVQQSGGQIHVESTVGVGSSFQVWLPAVEPPAPVSDETMSRGVEGLTGSERILLVEDEAAVRHLIRTVLERYGYTVIEAANGEEAVRLAAEAGSLDLVVTDVVMPRIDGPALAAALRESCPDLPLIYLTGYADDVLQRDEIERGTVPLLHKPFTSGALLRLVRRVLDGQTAQIG
jgi:PAS domain S-box-containing protein